MQVRGTCQHGLVHPETPGIRNGAAQVAVSVQVSRHTCGEGLVVHLAQD